MLAWEISPEAPSSVSDSLDYHGTPNCQWIFDLVVMLKMFQATEQSKVAKKFGSSLPMHCCYHPRACRGSAP
jgi:hypothetical protein